jgi:hypothetical protein
VATGSHGSSLSYGSLSSDETLFALDVVLANGVLHVLWARHAVSAGRTRLARCMPSQARWCR